MFHTSIQKSGRPPGERNFVRFSKAQKVADVQCVTKYESFRILVHELKTDILCSFQGFLWPQIPTLGSVFSYLIELIVQVPHFSIKPRYANPVNRSNGKFLHYPF
jgi:hypothetical protein